MGDRNAFWLAVLIVNLHRVEGGQPVWLAIARFVCATFALLMLTISGVRAWRRGEI